MLFETACVICQAGIGPVCPACDTRLRRRPIVGCPGLDLCRAAFELDDQLKLLVAAMKYRRQRRLARWLADAMMPLVPRACDAITWVPATPTRRRERGFDQGAELARLLSRSTAVPLQPLLRRSERDGRQTSRTRIERQTGPALASVHDAPRFVVVVDDVMTTGSSLRVAAERLRDAGAERIVGVVAAATPLRHHVDTRLESPRFCDWV